MGYTNTPTDSQNAGTSGPYSPARGWPDRSQGANSDPDSVRADGESGGNINRTGAADGHGFGQFSGEHNGVGGAPATAQGHGSIVPGNDGDGDDSFPYNGPAQSGAGR